MNPLLKKLLAPRRIEYLTLNRDLLIQEMSLNIQKFADCPDEVREGRDVRLSFPELIGVEDILIDVLEGQQISFELLGIGRCSESGCPQYIDICAVGDQDEDDSENRLFVFVEDATERMVLRQTLVQRENEANLLVSALANSKNYIEKIIASMADALLVTNRQGNIKTVNKAARDLFGYGSEELIGQPISIIIGEENLLCKANQGQRLERGELLKDVEVVCRTKTGKEITVAFSCSAVQTDIEGLEDFVYIGRDITLAKQAETALQQANEKLTIWVKELEQRNREITLLSELGNLLQACLKIDEAYIVIGHMMQSLFPDLVGGVFVMSRTHLVESVAIWGNPPPSFPDSRGDVKGLNFDFFTSKNVFAPQECCALRRGQMHVALDTHSGLLCKHLYPNSWPSEYCCIPMMAHGEALGLFYLSSLSKGRLTEVRRLLARTVAENIALALANLRLRETLENQRVHDPLTGLFNRCYLDESLEFEIQRSSSLQQSLGIIMLDVDHFKVFNDTFGHATGDAVLGELALFLKKNIRGADIACRYGGEELIIILLETSLEATRQLADQLVEGARSLEFSHLPQTLGGITISAGVACFPEHGRTAWELLQAADAALERAKRLGRDRVVTAWVREGCVPG